MMRLALPRLWPRARFKPASSRSFLRTDNGLVYARRSESSPFEATVISGVADNGSTAEIGTALPVSVQVGSWEIKDSCRVCFTPDSKTAGLRIARPVAAH